MSILRTGGSLASTRMVFAAASAAWRIAPKPRFLTTPPPPPPTIDTQELLSQVSRLQNELETFRTQIVRKHEKRSTASVILDGAGCLCLVGIVGWVVYSIANLGIEKDEIKRVKNYERRKHIFWVGRRKVGGWNGHIMYPTFSPSATTIIQLIQCLDCASFP